MTIACTNNTPTLNPNKPLIVAHRGGADLGMENSLSCISKGIAAGADMVEIDVHLTADGEVVVCHDATIDRTTNGKGKIEKLTLNQIRGLRLLNGDGTPSDETVPTLEEVLQLVKGRCALLLEIKKKKDQYEGIEQKVADLIVKYDMQETVVVQSFNDYVLKEMHRLLPDLRLELLSFTKVSNVEDYPFISSFNICRYFVTARYVERIHRQGREVKIWTVKRPCRASRLPVDGIITNDPNLFL